MMHIASQLSQGCPRPACHTRRMLCGWEQSHVRHPRRTGGTQSIFCPFRLTRRLGARPPPCAAPVPHRWRPSAPRCLVWRPLPAPLRLASPSIACLAPVPPPPSPAHLSPRAFRSAPSTPRRAPVPPWSCPPQAHRLLRPSRPSPAPSSCSAPQRRSYGSPQRSRPARPSSGRKVTRLSVQSVSRPHSHSLER